MRTEIKIHSSKVTIPETEETSIDEAWNLWTIAVREKNKELKQKFSEREKMLLEIGNQSRMSNDLLELKKLHVEAKKFRDTRIGTEAWNEKELICSDNLGNKLYLESFEVKSYEKRVEQINYLIDTIETEIELLKLENQSSQEPIQIFPYIKFNSHTEIKSILSKLEDSEFKKTDKQTFAAVALIIYNKDIFNKKKCPNFNKWLNVFSDYYDREISAYKPGKLKDAITKAIVQYPFLEHDHKGSLQKGNLI